MLTEKCSTCIFRPGNLMQLRPGRLEQMVRTCLDEDTVIPCHQTLDGKRSVCRGLYDVHARDITIMRMAAALNVFAYADPPQEHP